MFSASFQLLSQSLQCFFSTVQLFFSRTRSSFQLQNHCKTAPRVLLGMLGIEGEGGTGHRRQILSTKGILMKLHPVIKVDQCAKGVILKEVEQRNLHAPGVGWI